MAHIYDKQIWDKLPQKNKKEYIYDMLIDCYDGCKEHEDDTEESRGEKEEGFLYLSCFNEEYQIKMVPIIESLYEKDIEISIKVGKKEYQNIKIALIEAIEYQEIKMDKTVYTGIKAIKVNEKALAIIRKLCTTEYNQDPDLKFIGVD